MLIPFNCPRSCPHFEQVDQCRFNAMFRTLGPTVVTSHTVKTKCTFLDNDTFGKAAVAMGGATLGMATHRLFSGQSATGYGVTLPGWRFPIVLANGELAYDNYQGAWGNEADLERLRGEYVLATAESAAQVQGWMTQRDGMQLTIFHPSGGQMIVTGDGAEAVGFMGQGCHSALGSLGLNISEWTAKPEFTQVAAEVQVQS